MSLISKGLGAVWSVIYLTENISEDGQAKLFPFAIYPQTESESFWKLPPIDLAEVWRQPRSSFIVRLLPNNLTEQLEIEGCDSRQPPAETKQLILPLIHQETFIGLLVTGREDRKWQAAEAQQIEQIARTISIARFMEFQYHWTQDKLALQENLRKIEHDRLDNLLHQLKNPLTALRTFSKLLLKRILPNDSNAGIVESILSQSDRFQELLEQFEAESRSLPEVDISDDKNLPMLATNRENVDRSSFLLPSSIAELNSVDLQEIITPIVNTAQAIAEEREIKLIDNLPDRIPLVKGNLTALREILNNLIDNALKYTMAGGKVQLDLKTNRDDMLGIAIQDTGVGIPKSDRERIFERHYRGVQAQGSIPGTGLGLAIARELANKMQGEIELISPNHLASDRVGTTVILWLFAMNSEQW